MGTRSYIAKQLGEDAYLTIFCQIEGHLGSTGKLLAEHYNTPELVDKLLAQGDIYSVESTVNPNHSFYGKKGEAATVMTVEDLMEGEYGIEYLYFFTQDNRWKYLCCDTEEMELRDVQEALLAEEHRMCDPNDYYGWLKADLNQFLVPSGEKPVQAMQM